MSAAHGLRGFLHEPRRKLTLRFKAVDLAASQGFDVRVSN
jgi:hypothetical protein